MRARDQSSIFSTGRKFRPDYGLLLELHTLTLVARSYALLSGFIAFQMLYWGGDRQTCVMPCSSSDRLSLSVRQKDYNNCYSNYPELHMYVEWHHDTLDMVVLGTHCSALGFIFFFCFILSWSSSIHSNFSSSPSFSSFPFLSPPSLIPLSTFFSFPPHYSLLHSCPYLPLPFLSPPLPLSPYPPSSHFIPPSPVSLTALQLVVKSRQ